MNTGRTGTNSGYFTLITRCIITGSTIICQCTINGRLNYYLYPNERCRPLIQKLVERKDECELGKKRLHREGLEDWNRQRVSRSTLGRMDSKDRVSTKPKIKLHNGSFEDQTSTCDM